MPRPTPVRGLGPTTPAPVAARRIIAARLNDVLVHEGPLLRERTDEGVHDMRVACRRLRAALHVFASLGDLEEAEAEVKHLQDALGEVRDRHVQLAWLGSEAGASRALRGMKRELPEREERLLRALRRFRRRGVLRVTAASEALAGDGPLAGSAVRRVLRRRLRQLERRMSTLRHEPSATHAHEVRKTVKKLRYEVEIVRPALPRTLDSVAELLRPFQELLGDLHDHDVRLEILAGIGSRNTAALHDHVAGERAELMSRTAQELQRWRSGDVLGVIRERIDRAMRGGRAG